MIFKNREYCNICGAEKTISLVSMKYSDPRVAKFIDTYYERRVPIDVIEQGKYELLHCSSCKFTWQKNILTDKWMNRLYSDWIDPNSSLAKKIDSRAYELLFPETFSIKNLFPKVLPRDIRTLDFGSGWGVWCNAAKKQGYQAEGFEIASNRREYCREQGIRVYGEIDEIKDKTYHFINCEQVIEHVESPKETMRFLADKLMKDGVIRVAVPDGTNILSEIKNPKWQPTKGPVQPLEHINCFTYESLIEMGKSIGLRLIPPPYLTTLRFGLKPFIGRILDRYNIIHHPTRLYFRRLEA